ncbi:hypothetical protein ONZ45_g10388 [Pleurotus djamor]|nr:hypothetical protein ONZ45_g10388 [Pleurotus djamor]
MSLKREERQAKHALRRLKIQITQQNVVPRRPKATSAHPSYISRLPNEILAMIFVFRRNDAAACSSAPSARLRWLRVGMVCRRWRQVSLSTPQLWTHISLGLNTKHNNLAEDFLRRSKLAPLSLDVAFASIPKDVLQPKDLFLDTIPTRPIRSLSLSSDGDDVDTVGSLMTSCSISRAPYLRSLSLNGNTSRGELANDYLWPEMPALRELKITEMPLPSPFPHLPSLRALKLSLRRSNWSTMTPLQILQILQDTPLVEEVDLSPLAGNIPAASSSNNFPCAHLPHLKSLYLTMQSINTTHIFEYLTFPSSTAVNLMFTRQPLTLDSIESSTMQELPQYFTRDGFRHTHLAVYQGGIGLELFNEGTDSSTPRLTIYYPTPFEPFLSLFVCPPPERMSLYELHEWRRLLPSFSPVKSLTLFNCPMSDLDSLEPPEILDRPTLLPNLEELVLQGYRLGEVKASPERVNEYHKLSNLLCARQIKTVRIKDGSTTGTIQRHLSNLVGVTIEWENMEF